MPVGAEGCGVGPTSKASSLGPTADWMSCCRIAGSRRHQPEGHLRAGSTWVARALTDLWLRTIRQVFHPDCWPIYGLNFVCFSRSVQSRNGNRTRVLQIATFHSSNWLTVFVSPCLSSVSRYSSTVLGGFFRDWRWLPACAAERV